MSSPAPVLSPAAALDEADDAVFFAGGEQDETVGRAGPCLATIPRQRSVGATPSPSTDSDETDAPERVRIFTYYVKIR